MSEQHPAPSVHDCGLEAALQQMSIYLERLRSHVSDDRGMNATTPRVSHVFVSESDLRLLQG
ncbi:hypothetical protein [Xanthomonas albilineans]|uniref:hypothetical protein n=1 Tax=Xanthomonas albilineans TaxID=29447 RepID=UPI0005F359AA|nr:hypothetical protein [Xanthomonas albilineans]